MKTILNALVIALQNTLRRSKIKYFTNNISINAKIYDSEVGDYNYFGPNVIINNTKISNYCSVAPNVVIGGMEHDYRNFSTSTRLFPNQAKIETIIQDDVWIGANAVIKMGVTLGKGSIIGANAIVLKDVPPLSIVVGNPGKVLKLRFESDKEKSIYFSIDFAKRPNDILKSL